jgi:hypothetical protein
MQWHKLNIGAIISGTNPNGAPYLKQFLIDYKKEFNVEVVNPSCERCLKSYHDKFIKKYDTMENESKYRLHKKREGLQLEFGSATFVTNKNITDEYAETLINRYKKVFENKGEEFSLDYLFDTYPKEDVKQIEVLESKEVKPKKTRKTRKKRK